MATGAKRQGDDPVPEADLPKYEGLLKVLLDSRYYYIK